jgi:hypothetical protein
VINVFGITMTPNHKLLVNGSWMEAKDVGNSSDAREKARYGKGEIVGDGVGQMPELQHCLRNSSTKCTEEQSAVTSTLQALHVGGLSSDDEHSLLENMARNEVESDRHNGQKLRRSWDNCLRRMGVVRQLLQGHVRKLLGRTDDRKGGRKPPVLQEQLSMGNQHGAAIEQKKQQVSDIPRAEDSPCGTGQTVRVFKNDVGHETKQGDVCRRGGEGLHGIRLWEKRVGQEQETQGKAHVYDLVDCGPRHQFLIRNAQGEMFISHNSMGHGVDGLQQTGHTLVWFGLNWSLELYDQFNKRLHRQGQGAPVMCHRILMLDTLDQAQALALDEKAATQSGLRNAVKMYRQQKGV